MGVTAAIALGGLATGYQVYQGQRAAKAQKNGQAQALQQSQKTLQQSQKAAREADIANNKANRKRPNAVLDAAKQAGKHGQSGTLLTGPQGVDPSSLSLGKSTLLG